MDITSLIHFLTDKSRNLSSKAAVIILTLLFLLVLDNTFSFSYYYNTSEKVTQLNEISTILKDTSLSRLERDKLIKLRTNILDHKTFKDRSYDYLTNLNFESSIEISEEEPKKELESIAKTEIIRNYKIHLLTSAWWILLPLGILCIVIPFVLIIERKDTITTLLGFLFIIGFGYLVSLILSKIFSYIPLIDQNPIWNYLLNFVLSVLLLSILIIIGKKSKR